MTEERTPRALKIYVVTDPNGSKMFIKAKTKTAALNYVMGQHLKVVALNQNNLVELTDAIANGTEIHEVA